MYWLTQCYQSVMAMRALINVIHRSIKPQPLTGQGHPRALTGVGRQASRKSQYGFTFSHYRLDLERLVNFANLLL
jgi:hypothetical protein